VVRLGLNSQRPGAEPGTNVCPSPARAGNGSEHAAPGAKMPPGRFTPRLSAAIAKLMAPKGSHGCQHDPEAIAIGAASVAKSRRLD